MANHLIHPGFVGAYVYAVTVDGVIRYFGKGRRYRAIEHFRLARELNERRAAGEKIKALPFHNKLAKALRVGSELGYIIIANRLDDGDAYERERAEISAAAPGQLWNLHCGGSGGDAELSRRRWSDPDYRARTVKAAVAAKRTPEYRARARATAKAHWDDPTYHAQQVAREKALWADPGYRAGRVAILQKVWADPDRSARKSALVKSQWTPERKAAMSENRRKAWSDPAFKARATASIRASKKR